MDAQIPGTGLRSHTFWDLYSHVYNGVYHLIPYRNLLWDAFSELELKAGMRVLDAGCGTGNFEHFIAGKSLPPIALDGIDSSSSMLRSARRRCRRLDFARFAAADLNERLPFDDDTFDCVVSINVLYALEDQDRATQELLRVLKPNGRIVISSPLPTYRVLPMVADHFRRIRNIWGLGRRIRRIAESVWVLGTSGAMQWALNNLVIDSREAQGRYRSLDVASFSALLQRRRADGLRRFDVRLASAGQNVFAVGDKAVAA